MNAAQVLNLDELNFEKSNGVVTVVTQDATTGVVLMVAHANREAMERTQSSGEMFYTSRTRGLWHKGATSGNVQRVVSLSADCDGDAVLARVKPAGPACHTGQVSCFGSEALGADANGKDQGRPRSGQRADVRSVRCNPCDTFGSRGNDAGRRQDIGLCC